jgi:hypothetical protein
MAEERLKVSLGDNMSGLHLESVRGFICGVDDVVSTYPKISEALYGIRSERLRSRNTFASTSNTGIIRINETVFSRPFGLSASTGRHEGGHLIEVYLSDGDYSRFVKASDAKRILSRAFRAYKKSHAGKNTTLYKEISSVSINPAIAQSLLVGKNPTVLYSEGLAECIDRIIGQDVERDSFLYYVSESIGKEVG